MKSFFRIWVISDDLGILFHESGSSDKPELKLQMILFKNNDAYIVQILN